MSSLLATEERMQLAQTQSSGEPLVPPSEPAKMADAGLAKNLASLPQPHESLAKPREKRKSEDEDASLDEAKRQKENDSDETAQLAGFPHVEIEEKYAAIARAEAAEKRKPQFGNLELSFFADASLGTDNLSGGIGIVFDRWSPGDVYHEKRFVMGYHITPTLNIDLGEGLALFQAAKIGREEIVKAIEAANPDDAEKIRTSKITINLFSDSMRFLEYVRKGTLKSCLDSPLGAAKTVLLNKLIRYLNDATVEGVKIQYKLYWMKGHTQSIVMHCQADYSAGRSRKKKSSFAIIDGEQITIYPQTCVFNQVKAVFDLELLSGAIQTQPKSFMFGNQGAPQAGATAADVTFSPFDQSHGCNAPAPKVPKVPTVTEPNKNRVAKAQPWAKKKKAASLAKKAANNHANKSGTENPATTVQPTGKYHDASRKPAHADHAVAAQVAAAVKKAAAVEQAPAANVSTATGAPAQADSRGQELPLCKQGTLIGSILLSRVVFIMSGAGSSWGVPYARW